MGNLVFQATLGGQVNLVGPNTASTYNINVPTVNGNLVTTGDTGTVTNTMLASSAYAIPGTIGSTTPNSGAFTTLAASGTITYSGLTASTALALDASKNVVSVTNTGSGNNVLATSPTLVTPVLGTPTSGNLSNCTADGTNSVGYRNIPQNSQTGAYTLVAGDVGKHISITTGGVTCNASVFSAGDVVSIFNNSSSNQTITAGTNVTFRLAGTATTGNRTLAQYGVATLLCTVGGATPTFVVSGNVT